RSTVGADAGWRLICCRQADPEGAVKDSQEAIIAALAEIGEALREQELTLDGMIERGRAIRGQLFEERYGIAECDIVLDAGYGLSDASPSPGAKDAGLMPITRLKPAQ
ncbi:MAG TPA: hypothetical protein VFQ80_16140, partial [Thermomicrobiales bacterium]|nr:hypothetical protein [Thermomicrobiales bacterium]